MPWQSLLQSSCILSYLLSGLWWKYYNSNYPGFLEYLLYLYLHLYLSIESINKWIPKKCFFLESPQSTRNKFWLTSSLSWISFQPLSSLFLNCIYLIGKNKNKKQKKTLEAKKEEKIQIKVFSLNLIIILLLHIYLITLIYFRFSTPLFWIDQKSYHSTPSRLSPSYYMLSTDTMAKGSL